jgi:hypothetical protein
VVQGGAQEDGRDQDTEKERDDARPKGRICPEPLDDCVQLAERVGALPEDGPEATQVGGECAEADVEVDGARTEAVNGLATALAERGDRVLDPDPGGELSWKSACCRRSRWSRMRRSLSGKTKTLRPVSERARGDTHCDRSGQLARTLAPNSKSQPRCPC